MARTLERIRFNDPDTGRTKTEWAEIVSDGPQLVLYRPLKADGDDQSYYDKAGTLVEIQRLLSTDLIVWRRPARINPKYGSLEVIQ